MAANRIPYTAVAVFEPHQGSVNWHMPTEEFRWSKACRVANPEIERTFRDYCNQHRSGRLIYNKNNDSDTVWIHGDKLTHNAHGINAYADRLDYAFMSAIQPTAFFNNFLRERCGLSGGAVAFAFSGYNAYQLIMRTALRDPNNTQPVNVFALDTDMILGVMDLFDQRHSTHSPHIPVVDTRARTRGKGSKSAPLTSTQRSQLRRARLQAEKNTP
jgi:hypothetical protein